MTAIWVLAFAVVLLAAVITAVAWAAWAYFGGSRLDSLSDEEIAERLAPCVAAELLIMAAQDAPPPEGIEDIAP